MFTAILLCASAACAVVPTVLFCVNLRRYRAPGPLTPEPPGPVSVLIPARNEEANIAEALRCVLASRSVSMEVLVLDDDSSDRTGEVVQQIAAKDARVRLVCGRGLPPGWNGKQHACWVLANEAVHPVLVFLDADVRVEPELFSRVAAFRERTGTALVSGFPRLITVTWLEKLLLPLIHFVLLGFLPMSAMRRTSAPSLAAGCGQFMLVQREAYFSSGGHEQLRETMHDGLLLPRVLRRHGYLTDIADITDLASVRMYDSAAKVWQGLAKNATEGIATAGRIVPLSLMLLLGQVLPVALALGAVLILAVLAALHSLGSGSGSFLVQHSPKVILPLFVLARGGDIIGISGPLRFGLFMSFVLAGTACAYLPRLLAVRRFRQPLGSALLHPLGVIVLLAVQWYAFGRKLFGRPVGWRQRSYSSGTGTQIG